MEYKRLAVWLYLISTVCYLIGVIRLTGEGAISGIIFLSLGSAFLCLASATTNMSQEREEKEKSGM